MLARFFIGRSPLLKYVKIFLLALLCINAVFSVVILIRMASNKDNIFPYLGVNVKLTEPQNDKIDHIFEAIYKTALEEVSLFLILEFMGFFSILFDNVYLVLMYASGYLMPSIRITLNLAFGKDITMALLIFQILKVVCALESFHFAYLIKHECIKEDDTRVKMDTQSDISNSTVN